MVLLDTLLKDHQIIDDNRTYAATTYVRDNLQPESGTGTTSSTKKNIVNTVANLRVKRIRNSIGDEELQKKFRLKTAMIEKEKAIEELKKATYETELAKLKLESYINSR
ncbi:hypothetical protein FQA39_LY08584 [Lamprigera yunnana]|nr:hypothetical protein FQA39_LY08584 [Lamprigera yunnana]